ncbi:MAG: hypothetical protein ACRYGF_03365 [Janthinobacterium lividum]
MRLLLIPALSTVLLPSFGAPAPTRYRAWQWQRSIQPAEHAPADEQCVLLDAEVYAAASPGLRDVRLLQDGHEIAYALQESYDKPALHAGPDGKQLLDRSVYTTVLQIPLKEVRSEGSPLLDGSGLTAYGEAMLPGHVPVERIALVPDQAMLARPIEGQTSPTVVHLYLSATPTARLGSSALQPIAAEVIEDNLDADQPVEQTAIGANLQSSARVAVTVQRGSRQYSNVLLQMHQRSICYQPLSSAPLLLLYGNEDARPVRYDYSAHYRPTSAPLFGLLGRAELNPGYHAKAATASEWRITRLQRLLLAVGVALVGFLLTAVPLLRKF